MFFFFFGQNDLKKWSEKSKIKFKGLVVVVEIDKCTNYIKIFATLTYMLINSNKFKS